MHHIAAIVFALSVAWTSLHSVVVTWEGSGDLFINGAHYQNYNRPGVAYIVEIGGPNTDALYRPVAGSPIKFIHSDGSVEETQVGLHRVFLPAVR